MSELGVPGALIPGGTQEGRGKFAGRVVNHPHVKGLLSDPNVISVLTQCFGHMEVDVSNPAAQVALRFPEDPGYEDPEDQDRDPDNRGTSFRIDDRAWHTDGLRRREPSLNPIP